MYDLLLKGGRIYPPLCLPLSKQGGDLVGVLDSALGDSAKMTPDLYARFYEIPH